MTLTAGAKLGRYEIRSLIGVGGNARVRSPHVSKGSTWRPDLII